MKGILDVTKIPQINLGEGSNVNKNIIKNFSQLFPRLFHDESFLREIFFQLILLQSKVSRDCVPGLPGRREDGQVRLQSSQYNYVRGADILLIDVSIGLSPRGGILFNLINNVIIKITQTTQRRRRSRGKKWIWRILENPLLVIVLNWEWLDKTDITLAGVDIGLLGVWGHYYNNLSPTGDGKMGMR